VAARCARGTTWGVRVFAGLPTAVPALAASGGEALRLNVGPDALLDRFVAASAGRCSR
jgi:hypothetical protein